MIRIDLFCESGEEYGLGHLNRCKNFLLLLEQNYPSIVFQSTFHSLPCPNINGQFEIVIIDSYIASLEFYHLLYKNSKLLLCLDDFLRLPYPKKSLILSPTYGSEQQKKNFYGGKDYVILNPIFHTLTPLQSERKNHILITLGGSNQNELIEHIVQILSPLSSLVFHIISPSYTKVSKQIKIYSNLSSYEVCSLIDSCEFAICSSGGSLNEILSRRKKTIALCIAKNQKRQLQSYCDSKLVLPIFNPYQSLETKLIQCFKRLPALNTPKIAFGSKLPQLFKTALLHFLTSPSYKPFEFLTYQEKIRVLHLRNQNSVRQASFNSSAISKKTHLLFIKQLKQEDFYFAFLMNKKIYGVAYLNLIHKNIGIYRHKNALGLGSHMIKTLISIATKLNLPTIFLKVLKINTKALHFYQKHQFQVIKEEQNFFIMQKNLRKTE